MATDNTLKNTDLVIKRMVLAFLNELQMAGKVDRQLDSSGTFQKKVGGTAKIRRPVYFTSSEGAVITEGQTSAIEEATVLCTLDKRRKVVFNISSEEETLNIEDAYERYIVPAAQELAQDVENDIAEIGYKGFYNFIGTPGTSPSTFLDVANAKAKLNLLGVPMDGKRCAFYGPLETVALSDGLKAVFPTKISVRAIENATFGYYGGFMCYENQSLAAHTVGVATGTPLIDGASQNTTYLLAKDTDTQTLNTDGWTNSQTGILLEGDVIEIDGVYAVNRRTRKSTTQLAQFVVTADADSSASTGDAALTVSPPIITSGPYKTCDSAPADGATITVKTGTGGTAYTQNLAFHKNAITLAFARLTLPTAGAESSRMTYKDVSIRLVKQYDSVNDETRWRFDILYLVKVQNGGFGVRTTS
jgi:hypothetical protein